VNGRTQSVVCALTVCSTVCSRVCNKPVKAKHQLGGAQLSAKKCALRKGRNQDDQCACSVRPSDGGQSAAPNCVQHQIAAAHSLASIGRHFSCNKSH